MFSNQDDSLAADSKAEEPCATLGTQDHLPTGSRLGGFVSLWGLVLLSLSIGAVVTLVDEFRYSMKSEPIEIASSSQLSELEDGDYVRLTGKLDNSRAIIADKAAGDAYLVVPLAGTDLRLWVSIKGGAVSAVSNAEKEITLSGRIAQRSGTEWTIGDGRDLDLSYQAKRLFSAEVSDSTLVLRAGVIPGEDMTFTFVAGGVGILILSVFARRLIGALAGVARPQAG